jgi:hypothetical protein
MWIKNLFDGLGELVKDVITLGILALLCYLFPWLLLIVLLIVLTDRGV